LPKSIATSCVEWQDGEWDDLAEDVHGISKFALAQQGREALVVVRDLWRIIGNKKVYSDGFEMDQFWLDRLGGLMWPPLPTISVRPIQMLSGRVPLPQNLMHRAGPDVAMLRDFISKLQMK
jgi:hypothetical protein